MRLTYTALAAGLTLLAPALASAQTCAQIAAEWQQKSNQGYTIDVFITTVQKNGLVSSNAFSTDTWNGGQIKLAWNAAAGEFRGASWCGPGLAVFNDRYRSDVAGQPFSTQVNATDPLAFTFDSALSRGSGTNQRWGSRLAFQTVTCANGIIYGWGTPVGNYNGANALWAISYRYGSPCLN